MLGAAPKEEWLPVSPEDLAATASQIEPDAPAEVLFSKVEIDDRDYPQRRVVHEYIRYKLFRPEQIDAITRLEVFSNGAGSNVKLRGRLTLPNGDVKTFSEESIRERTQAQSAGEKNFLTHLFGTSSGEIKERFLAISGVDAGAILEYRIEHTTNQFIQGFPLQIPILPIRLLEYHIQLANMEDWDCKYFVFHKNVGHVTLDHRGKKDPITITATDLPSMPREPFMAQSPAFYGLYFLFSYQQLRINYIARKPGFSKYSEVDSRITGPWSPFSNREFRFLDDRIDLTYRIRQLAAKLIAGANTPLEKARRIHQEVQALYAVFHRESKRNHTMIRLNTISRTLDDLLDYSRNSQLAGLGRLDYMALAMALYEGAGLESKAIMLPDHRILPFNRHLVAFDTLPERAVAVHIDGKWIYSMPDARPAQAFGTLPWYCEGESGLWVQAGKEEFATIPFSPVGESFMGNGGKFELNADGMLTGEAQWVFRGHSAESLRDVLVDRDKTQQRNYFTRRLKSEFKLPGSETSSAGDSANVNKTGDAEDTATTADDEGMSDEAASRDSEVVITNVTGVEDTDSPIMVFYRLRIPGFAVVTAGKMIFRPFLFRLNSSTPFTASTRKLDVRFPYAWEELDSAVIKLPPDYTPEFSEPAVMKPGSPLDYTPRLAYDAEKHELQVRREFANQFIVVPVSAYEKLKASYDDVVRGDNQEVVLSRTPAPAGGAHAEP